MIGLYRIGDAQKVCVQEAQCLEASKFADCFERIFAYSLYDHQQNVLAVFGFDIISFDKATCFALVGKNIGGHLLELIRFLKLEIPKQMKKYGLKSVMMTVRKDFQPGVRMARILGFQKRAELPKFYFNIDYQLFERIIK